MNALIISEPGYETDELISFASMLDSDEIKILSLQGYDDYDPDSCSNLLLSHLNKLIPDAIIMHEIPALSGIAASMAVKLNITCFTSIQGIDKRGETIKLVRSVLGGKAIMDIAAQFPAIITILPGAFEKRDFTSSSNVLISFIAPESAAKDTELPVRVKNLGISVSEMHHAGLPITEAEVLVSAGRGIVKPENLELMKRLAALFNLSAIAGSRAVVDSGWLPYSSQVGLTGKSVAPKLYIASGISGSPQHIAGMKNSKLIVAINKDPNAAIFNHAHYCIVEDLLEFIPVLIEKIEGQIR